MIKKILKEVEVSVTSKYMTMVANNEQAGHVFSYTITIINHSQKILQLLSRKWSIIDSLGYEKIVEGEGVIGKQPIFEHNTLFRYSSATQIESEIGKMQGEYIFKDLNTFEEFIVEIPAFALIVPHKLN